MADDKPKILTDNMLETYAAALTVSSEAAGYPKERLYDRRPFDQFAPASAGTLYITLDTNTPTLSIAPDTVVIAGHNLDTDTATIKYQSADNTGFSSNLVTHFTHIGGTDGKRDRVIWKEFSTGTVQRYHRFEITNYSTILRIGWLMLGARYAFPRYPQNGFSFRDKRMGTRIARNTDGHAVGASSRLNTLTISPVFRFFTEAQINAFEGLLYDIGGRPFAFAPNFASNGRAYIVTLTDQFDFKAPMTKDKSEFALQMAGPDLDDWSD